MFLHVKNYRGGDGVKCEVYNLYDSFGVEETAYIYTEMCDY
jgi:hypothetical protein